MTKKEFRGFLDDAWLQDLAASYLSQCSRDVESNLQTGYARGRIVLQVRDAKGYGHDAVGVFAKICHRGKSSLHRQAKVAACFSEEAFKQARAAAKQAGYPITFSIFEELATVDSAEVRDALLRETIEQRWKVRALRRAVAVRTGKAEAAPKRRVAAPAEASRPPDPYRGDKARASHATRAERIRAHLEGLHRETEEATDEEMEEVRPDLERELRHLRRKLGGNRTRGRVPVSGLGLADLPRLVSSVAEAVRTLRDTQRFPANPPAAASAS